MYAGESTQEPSWIYIIQRCIPLTDMKMDMNLFSLHDAVMNMYDALHLAVYINYIVKYFCDLSDGVQRSQISCYRNNNMHLRKISTISNPFTNFNRILFHNNTS